MVRALVAAATKRRVRVEGLNKSCSSWFSPTLICICSTQASGLNPIPKHMEDPWKIHVQYSGLTAVFGL
jgi:hypothetical protein